MMHDVACLLGDDFKLHVKLKSMHVDALARECVNALFRGSYELYRKQWG